MLRKAKGGYSIIVPKRGFYLMAAFNIFFIKSCSFYLRVAYIRYSTVHYPTSKNA